jgi:hypothetical protein
MPPKEKKKTMWDKLADRIGDFAEENLWGVDEQFFKDKYGDNWESKYESSKKNVRSLYGLIPQTSGRAKTDAVMYALTLIMGRPAGVQMFRGVTKPAKTMIQGGRFKGSPDYEGDIFGQQSPFIASGYQQSKHHGKIAEKHVSGAGWAPDDFMNRPIPGRGDLIEFDIDPSFMEQYAVGGPMWRQYGRFGGYWPSVREGWSRGELLPGAREIQIKKSIPIDYIKNITPSKEIIRSKLPELGRY